ncbi:MAG TPA: twin transmembrane helix small protein [Burkholderiales bacterium]|nr:twin transmembrane helix small protein [Burkholderiales bacterium]
MDALTMIVLLGVLATVWALLRGITSMAHGGDSDFRHSHQLMFQRVGLQALTVLLVLMALLMQIR